MASKDKTAMGAFVIGGLLLFGLGLFLIGDRRMLFSKSAEYYTEFAQVSALEAGAKVRVGGMDAGEIVEIRVPQGPGSKFRLKFRIVEKLFPVIRTDSVASIADGWLARKQVSSDRYRNHRAGAAGMDPSKQRTVRDWRSVGEDSRNGHGDRHDSWRSQRRRHKCDANGRGICKACRSDHRRSSRSHRVRFTAAASKISEDAGAIIARVRAGEGTIGKLVNDDAVYNSVSGLR